MPHFEASVTPGRGEFEQQESSRLEDQNRCIIEVDGEPVGVVTRFEDAPAGGYHY